MKIGRSRTLKSTKYLEKRRKQLILNISLISIISLVFIAFLISLTWLPFLQIKNIKIGGLITLDNIELQKQISDELAGKYGYVIPKSNYLFYPADKIIKKISTNYKVESVEVETSHMSDLNVDVVERIPEVMVCDGFREDQESCFFADKTGYVFDKVSPLYDGDYVKYYLNTNLDSIQLGNIFMDQARFNELQKFTTNLLISGIKSSGILISEDKSYELYIENRNEGTAVIYFDDRIPFDKTFSNLIAFWQNSKDDFEYINLRFGNNIFYRIK